MSTSRYRGGERVLIRDRGTRHPDAESLAEYDGRSGTVFGHRSGFTVVSVDAGPLVDVRDAELEDLLEDAPAPAAPPAPAAAPSEPSEADIEEQAARAQIKDK